MTPLYVKIKNQVYVYRITDHFLNVLVKLFKIKNFMNMGDINQLSLSVDDEEEGLL